ncbi:MAG: sugar phosphate isomerase/epimerase [Opitutus sp.]|nr:sugar phosphate isomerase/epimerase [Opitutus sp.]
MNLVRFLLLALALANLPLTRAAAAPAPKIAVMSYSFGYHKGTFFDAIDKTALTGARFIEISPGQPLSPTDATKMDSLSDAQIALFRERLASRNVSVVSSYMTIPNDEAQARAQFVYAKKIGARNITTESYESVALLEKLAKEFDITVAFHFHGKQPTKPEYQGWDPNYIFKLVNKRDAHIGVCADTGHWATAGIVPLEAIKLLTGRIRALHLKDRPVIGQRAPDQVYGTGVVQIAEILRELERQRFSGPIIVEYETNPLNNVDEIKQCIEFVKTTLPATRDSVR